MTQFHSLLPVDEEGYYGHFGGAYIPEILQQNIRLLREAFYRYAADKEFNQELDTLLRDYVGRPTPLYRANRLSERYNTNIYLKREDLNHTGAHKINNALGSVLLAKRMGKHRIIAETGAGQHGVATATACALMGMECTVFMGATDVARQKPNVDRMLMLGAKVESVKSGSSTLKDATNEAINYWCSNPDTFYVIGSTVGPHPYPEMVAHFQSVISSEIRSQLLSQTGSELPDYVIACIGGGSNAAGAFYHFINEPSVRLIAAEAAGLGVDSGHTAATMTLGTEGILHGSRTLVMQSEDGNVIEPYSISAGLDYPGVGPLHSYLATSGRSQVLAITDRQALDAAFRLSRIEGIIQALESAHALGVLDVKRFKPTDTVVINVSGRGDKDMLTYMQDEC
ncbi:tryptophan synthase subunit beta [uncultured Duncaniella sp.]|uniref:tryptophan synthase subunit beta n=1 Tax=uncultured Duncaniella sp. TaxID=2768039 RepID=UPI002658E6C9|nr:tryptophan synthase subunit beta [uncultured Duncaniella sp.]